MVLICGINVDEKALPFAEELEYKIVPDEPMIGISLKTLARQETCVRVYLSEGLTQYKNIESPVKDKAVWFKDKNDLFTRIRGSEDNGKIAIISESKEDKDIPEQKVMSTVVPETPVSESDTLFDTEDGGIPEVSAELPDIFMQIAMADDENSLKQAMKNKDRIIEQQKSRLHDYDVLMNEVYAEQEKVILDVKKMYEDKLSEASVAYNAIKGQLESELKSGYAKYKVYGQYPRAVLQEGLSAEEKAKLPKDYSNIQVIACGGGDSLYRMLTMVSNNAKESSKPFVFVDLTGDYINSLHHKCEDVALMFKESMTEEIKGKITKGCRKVNNSVIVSCDPYHDITLLGVNWGIFLNNLVTMFSNKVNIVILLNSIQSFPVEYTLSKLATIIKARIFVQCTPVLIKYLYGKMSTIPVSRSIKWLVSDYFEDAESMLKAVAQKYSVVTSGQMFNLNTIDSDNNG